MHTCIPDALGWACAGADKRTWGNIYWNRLHVGADRWPLQPTLVRVLEEHRRLQYIFERLPCEDCRRHAKDYYWRNYPKLERGRLAYAAWMFNFHNSVNRRLGKPQYPWRAYVSRHPQLTQ